MCLLKAACLLDPLAQDISSQGWPTIFGQLSDAIVPLSSELNKLSGMTFDGVIHTSGIEKLNFNGPAELDSNTPIPGAVVNLLNEGVSGGDFHP
jgi:hypothetical protein